MRYPQEMYLPLMDRTVSVRNSEELRLCEQAEKLQAVLNRRRQEFDNEPRGENK